VFAVQEVVGRYVRYYTLKETGRGTSGGETTLRKPRQGGGRKKIEPSQQRQVSILLIMPDFRVKTLLKTPRRFGGQGGETGCLFKLKRWLKF